MNYNIGRIEVGKILPLFSFILILFSLYIAAQNKGVEGYEISLYDEYPMYFWYLIIFSIFICQISLFLNAFSKRDSYTWKAAYVGIVLANSIVLLIPLIRRYAIMGSGDPSSHMGLMLDILQTGHLGNNLYPINHILALITNLISGLDLNICMLLYPSFFYIFYALSFCLLMQTVLNSKTSILISIILVSIILNGSHFTPQATSNLYIPFVFYLYFSRFSGNNVVSYGILMVISSIVITFFHPLTTIFIIFSFSVFELSHLIFRRFKLNLDVNIKKSPYIIMIMIIIFWTWQSYAYIIFGTFNEIYKWLYLESTSTSMFEEYYAQISLIKPDPLFLLTSFVYAYGIGLILDFMGVISIIVFFKAWKNKKICMKIYFFMFSIIFVICVILGYLGLFIVTGTGLIRFLSYAFFVSFFLIPLGLEYLLRSYDRLASPLKLLLILLSILLLFLDFLNIFTLYISPIIMSPGQQVTDSQLIGMNTFFDKRDEDIQIIEGGLSVSRISDALYGTIKQLKNVNYILPPIPPHFGYLNRIYFSDNYNESSYLIMSTLFRIYYRALFPDFPQRWKFNQADFHNLENDRSVSKFYSNHEIDIYLLNPLSYRGL